LVLDPKQKQQCDQKSKDAQSFGEGKTQKQRTALPISGRRVAQGTGQELAKQGAKADTGGSGADGGKAGTDIFSCDWIHEFLLLSGPKGFVSSHWLKLLREKNGDRKS